MFYLFFPFVKVFDIHLGTYYLPNGKWAPLKRERHFPMTPELATGPVSFQAGTGGMGGTEGRSHHQEHEQSWEAGQKSLERKLLHRAISMEQGIPGGTCSLRERQPLKSGDSQCETGES